MTIMLYSYTSCPLSMKSVSPPDAPPSAYSTPEASAPTSASITTRLLSRPRPGAVNSGMRVVVASNFQLV